MRSQLKTAAVVCLLLSLACQVLGVARAPAPYCSSKPLYLQFPVAQEELITYDMSNAFSGYNLNIVMAKESPIASIKKK